MDDLILNCDYLILQSFNTQSYTGVHEIEYGYPIPGDYIRKSINNNWLIKYKNFKEKIIIGLSFIGNLKCCNSGGGRNNIFNLKYCEKVVTVNNGTQIQNQNPIDIKYADIYDYVVGNGGGYYGSGELWDFQSHTPYLNFVIFTQYENTKSMFYKIVNTGIGGISLMNIESLSQIETTHLNNTLK